MISQIDITGFRSIKEQSIPLKKLNILYGQNGSGKSSVMYAPYVFKNFCANPNQRLNSLFNLGFINLGGFENVTGDSSSSIEIIVHKKLDELNNEPFQLEFFLSEEGGIVSFKLGSEIKRELVITLPYMLGQKIELEYNSTKLIWDGFLFQGLKYDFKTVITVSNLNSLYEEIKNIEIISVRRGFFNPIFSAEPTQATDEALFAMQIRNESDDLEVKIDHYFKQLFDKTFRFVAIPGSTSFYLRTQNKKGNSTDLVNEGFGVNQTVYMLIKLLKKSTSLAFIEEPEIHLHPSAQAKLVDVFTEIIQKENKQIFITTHSESIVSSALAKIANGELSRDDVQFYLAVNEDGETKIIPQEVNDKGQIEGGLMNFMEAELSNLKSLLGI